MIGNRFGMLVVTARAGSQNRKKTWHCACDCGGKTISTTGNLNSGNSKSCGCEQRDAWVRARTTHGQSNGEKRTRAYSAWANMLTRCRNKKGPKYQQWGGRGIKVCKRWQKFENFLADMGEPPDGLSLDRIDNDGDYKPSNCRWTTAKVQFDNRRTPKTDRLLTLDGKTMNIANWSRSLGLRRDAVLKRLERGWPLREALTLPKGEQPRRPL